MGNKYKFVVKNGVFMTEHKAVWESENGPIPEGYEIHHINHDRKDNRLENLQLITYSEHARLHIESEKANRAKWDKAEPKLYHCVICGSEMWRKGMMPSKYCSAKCNYQGYGKAYYLSKKERGHHR